MPAGAGASIVVAAPADSSVIREQIRATSKRVIASKRLVSEAQQQY